MKNYGLDIEREELEESEEDYIFGSSTGVAFRGLGGIPRNKRMFFLPLGEVQRGREDTQACASNAPVNILETEFNYLLAEGLITDENLEWLESHGYVTDDGFEFSDAKVAIDSGTTRNGNSLKAPLQAINDFGLVPKALMPLDKDMTWADYHNPERITSEIEYLSEEFTKRFSINYEKVYNKNFAEVLERDMLVVAGYAWPRPINGTYPKTNNRLNHAFILFNLPSYYAFDSYIDYTDGDFIKKLSNDYLFYKYGYRVIINQKNVIHETSFFWERARSFFACKQNSYVRAI